MRLSVYALVFATGATGLVFQIVWQRYLALMLGSDSRSVAVVVAVFLAGLALGYRVWGRITERRRATRGQALALYGAAELGIAAYAAVFPRWFSVVREAAYRHPGTLGWDLAATAALLLLPTFLMGATIPLLTSALPKREDEIDGVHARVYGVNTLGACFGALVGAFWLVPWLGLSETLGVAGAVDAVAGLAALVGARAWWNAQVAEARPTLRGEGAEFFPVPVVLLLVFATGAVSIALENIVMRLVALNIGSAYYVFPLVLAAFVLGLGVGSLSLGRGCAKRSLVREVLKALVALVVLYDTVPHWPNWCAALRISTVGAVEGAYSYYLVVMGLFIAALLFVPLFFLGRLLPLAYAALRKDGKNFGRLCGTLYAVNTLGTVAGAIGLGHSLLAWANLDVAFQLALALLAAAAAVAWTQRDVGRTRDLSVATVAAAVVAIVAVPTWDRASYYVGLFRVRDLSAYGFYGLFVKPVTTAKKEVEFYKEGPDATVAVTRHTAPGAARVARSIFVNGKSDGNSLGDFSTMALVGTLGYLSLDRDIGISAAVVGMGTGITAGLLGRARDIERVEVAEISETMLEGARLFDGSNYGLFRNPKITLARADAFRYFARGDSRFDLVVAEPSNPWVAGVENLFTPEFYGLVDRRLAKGGVFIQWFHLYEMTPEIVLTVLGNLSSRFERAEVFLVGESDLAVLASHEKLGWTHLARRFGESFVRDAHVRSGITEVADLELLHLFDERYLEWLAREAKANAFRHDLDHPRLAIAANEARFSGRVVALSELLDPRAKRRLFDRPEKPRAVSGLFARYGDHHPLCSDALVGVNSLCRRYKTVATVRRRLEDLEHDSGWHALHAYGELRRQGLKERDPAFLAGVEAKLEKLARESSGPRAMARASAEQLVREYELDGLDAEARTVSTRLREAGLLNSQEARQ